MDFSASRQARLLLIIMVLTFVFPLSLQAQSNQYNYDSFACRFFNIVLIPLGGCRVETLPVSPTTNSVAITPPDETTVTARPTPTPPLPPITQVTPIPEESAPVPSSSIINQYSITQTVSEETIRRIVAQFNATQPVVDLSTFLTVSAFEDRLHTLTDRLRRQDERTSDSFMQQVRSSGGDGGGIVDGSTATDLTLLGASLQNAVLTSNLRTNGHWLSNDGDDEGIYITPSGRVGIGTSTPAELLAITGGALYLGDYVPPSSTNRLYASGGALY